MKEPENHEPRERRDGKVAEGQRREYQCTRNEQPPPSEQIGKRAGRQLQEHARERRRAHDEADERWAGAELAGKERQEWSAADRVAAVRDESGRTQPHQGGARGWRAQPRAGGVGYGIRSDSCDECAHGESSPTFSGVELLRAVRV